MPGTSNPHESGQQRLSSVLDFIIGRCELKQEKNGSFRGSCPARDSESGTGFIVTRTHDKILLDSKGGCTFADIVTAMGLKESDLFADAGRHQPLREGHTTLYRYRDMHNKVVYVVRRQDVPGQDKEILPGRMVNGRWLSDSNRTNIAHVISRMISESLVP